MPVAVITGAAQGIGRCTAEAMAAAGYDLALNDLHAPSETLAAVRGRGVDAVELVGDVADESMVRREEIDH